ncbi:hypothetical protein NECAME_04179 [Necator americanus]|uniref:Uncharacterized protein n=1 Tax=Necator americanus TaxID=51031 RepID=W2SWS2_NECAM|nr:hypothetical protein NECAME_04179 [Necator americanus]ETN73958.1 hypothetical protein NECAME_04179 [Necator americanus]
MNTAGDAVCWVKKKFKKTDVWLGYYYGLQPLFDGFHDSFLARDSETSIRTIKSQNYLGVG